jgi:hypothetical protein
MVARPSFPLGRGFSSAGRIRTVGKTPGCSRRRAVRCDSISAALVSSVACAGPRGLKPRVHGDRDGPAEAGPFQSCFRGWSFCASLVVGCRHRRVGGISADLVGGIVSHPSAKNALGWGTLGLVWERKTECRDPSLGVSGFCRRLRCLRMTAGWGTLVFHLLTLGGGT